MSFRTRRERRKEVYRYSIRDRQLERQTAKQKERKRQKKREIESQSESERDRKRDTSSTINLSYEGGGALCAPSKVFLFFY